MILVLNCGSQSIKWKVFNENLKLISKNHIEILNSSEFEKILEEELNKIVGTQINLIGHRVVYGGEKFIKPIKITENYLNELEKLNDLAPLHNPFNILGIRACQRIFKDIPQFAFFDTEFFANLPEKANTYALPEKFGYKRHGFHGISHEYVAKQAGGKNFKKLKIITCHLGGGASITATKNGKAIDTSMGFTPLEGLVMMTRPGNLDAGIILDLVEKLGFAKAKEILNKESGVKGICGEGEMLKVLQIINNKKTESPERSRRAELALDVFIYSIQKYIGSYFTILGGCDILVFTGSIGSGSAKIRNMICKDLGILNKTKVMAIETNEELAIAQKIIKL
ncbi:MAG: acetate kinase [Candidatus Gracilibacteria bacterium]|jgi:acetate kinase